MGKLGLRFLGAFQFLTVIPIHRSTVPPHEAALFFPLVGASVGLISCLPTLLELPAGMEAGLVLALQLALTGMLHEDGLADVADAVRAGRTREKMFEILKDSRIGSYGASALGVAILLRWQGLANVADPWRMVAASEALSRCAILWLGFATPAARQGMGAWLCESRDGATRAASLLCAAPCLYIVGWQTGLALAAGLIGMVLAARWYFIRRLGGVVGDCFGAVQQAAVIYCLYVYAWPIS